MSNKLVQNNFLKIIKLPTLLVFLVILGINGCASQNIGDTAVESYNSNPLTVTIPDGLSAEAVAKAMKSTLISRKWTIQSQSDNQVIGNLKHRGYDATVTLESDGSIITILNDSVFIDLDTKEEKPAVQFGWLMNIQKDLQSFLSSAS